MSVSDDTGTVVVDEPPRESGEALPQWQKQKDRDGWFIPARNRKGVIFRAFAEETVEEAYARDAKRQADRAAGKIPDPKPKVKIRSDSGKHIADDALVKALAELLSFPAVPAYAILHCEYCAMHFATSGPDTAVKLVKLSKDHPALRRYLERMYGALDGVAIGTILIGYLGKPIAHHLAPNDMLEAIGPQLGMPPRPEHNHNGEPKRPREQRARTVPFPRRNNPPYAASNQTPPPGPPVDQGPAAA